MSICILIHLYILIYICMYLCLYVCISVCFHAIFMCVFYFIMSTCLKFAIHEITKVWFFLNFFRHFCEKTIILILVCFFFSLKGTSAYAGPHYHKLYGRVIHVWDNRRGQPNLSAMKQPRSGRSSSVIKFASPSGKYAFSFDFFTYIIISYLLNCQLELQIINISHS